MTPDVTGDPSSIHQVREDDTSDTPLEKRTWRPSSILEHFPKIGGEDPFKTLVRPKTTIHLGADKIIQYENSKDRH